MNQSDFDNLKEGDIVQDSAGRCCFVLSRGESSVMGVETASISDKNGHQWMFADTTDLRQPLPATSLKLGTSVMRKETGHGAQNYKVSLVFPGLAIVIRKVTIQAAGEWRLVFQDSTERVRPIGPGRADKPGEGAAGRQAIA